MFCSRCGKKLMEYMRFCPYCGEKVFSETLSEDEPHTAGAGKQNDAAERSIFDERLSFDMETPTADALTASRTMFEAETAVEDKPDDNSVKFETETAETEKIEEEKSEEEKIETEKIETEEEIDFFPGGNPFMDETSFETVSEKPKNKGKQVKKRPEGKKTRPDPKRGDSVSAVEPKNAEPVADDGKTPQKRFNPNDLFFNSDEVTIDDDGLDDFDEFDEFEDDEEEESFVARHARGFVSFALLAVLLAVLLGWIISLPGQKKLAQIELAWNPKAYYEIGLEAAREGDYLRAAALLERASDKNPTKYDYAYYAAVEYLNAGDMEKAKTLVYRAVSIDPDNEKNEELLNAIGE